MIGFSLEVAARLLVQPNVEISYSFWGDTQVTAADPITKVKTTCDLEDLAKKIYQIHVSEKKEPKEYILMGVLNSKVHELYKLSDTQVNRATWYTQFFIAVKKWFSSLTSCIKIFPSLRDEIHMYENCYISIPRPIAMKEGFMVRHPPDHSDSALDNFAQVHYSSSQAAQIYRQWVRV